MDLSEFEDLVDGLQRVVEIMELVQHLVNADLDSTQESEILLSDNFGW